MNGIAQNQFPSIIFEENKKLLWNPITRKKAVIRPEELVRLQWVEALIHLFNVKKSRIVCEHSVLTEYKNSTLRADIIVYNQDFKPHLLIECKAPSVELSDTTALQAGLYNTKFDAPYILLTNGLQDVWFHNINGNWTRLENVPMELMPQNGREFDVDFWISRGFLGKLINREHIKVAYSLFAELFLDGANPVRYRTFGQHPLNINTNHYYAELSLSKEKVFTSFFADSYGKTMWCTLVSRNNMNEQLILVDVDAAFATVHPHIWVFRKGKMCKGRLPESLFSPKTPLSDAQTILSQLVQVGNTLC